MRYRPLNSLLVVLLIAGITGGAAATYSGIATHRWEIAGLGALAWLVGVGGFFHTFTSRERRYYPNALPVALVWGGVMSVASWYGTAAHAAHYFVIFAGALVVMLFLGIVMFCAYSFEWTHPAK